MKLMPIVYVTDMARALDFYTALGLQPLHADRSGMWSELALGDALLGLHKTDRVPPEQIGHIELALLSEEPLEGLVTRLRAADLTLEREITDEAFGRSILLHDPDGLTIQVNEHDTSLYT